MFKDELKRLNPVVQRLGQSIRAVGDSRCPGWCDAQLVRTIYEENSAGEGHLIDELTFFYPDDSRGEMVASSEAVRELLWQLHEGMRALQGKTWTRLIAEIQSRQQLKLSLSYDRYVYDPDQDDFYS